MEPLQLFGTLTSPYVRRVRIVAQELGLHFELVDTATDSGQAALRKLNPLWKVPAVRIQGQAIFDSGVITRHLLRLHGPGPLTPWSADDLVTCNLVTAIDGALDALINIFYLANDGLEPDQVSYLQKHRDRAAEALSWVEQHAPEQGLGAGGRFGLPEVALITALDWMRFRNTYPVDRHPRLAECCAQQAARPSVLATAPPA